ncbi:hypothetical protein Wxf_01383 [Wolbachia endosymbiont of Armadillidium vulgare]|nr:hypothetical protein Wxf_02981 [Armadillidium vulgare] [Wolbachia endosymbiont of Armadillidium vulgare]OJH30711.1 hypothetical protein Wxf_00067 [Wolbachia endosymbiont of Armadillidium vulgare]OJH31954.1 hypothetical protein Wxf_01372 [Wolbachia endosymbiont of Armadillidium vulgare]OJH31965.1 hypothetical protein Wxf_01383 [Wolbachia endosymbiont of Armadillidium vulgare]
MSIDNCSSPYLYNKTQTYDYPCTDDKELSDKKIIEEDDHGVKDNNEKVINVNKPYIILEKLALASDIRTGCIIDYKTRESTGQKMQDCFDILNGLYLLKLTDSGKILGKCGDNINCKNCIDAINVSVLPDTQHNLDEDQYYFGDQMSL